MGSSPSVARRVSTPGASANHQFPVFKAFREGKHSTAGLPWSITVDEASIAAAKRNGYTTWEQQGQYGGRPKIGRGADGKWGTALPRLKEAPLACASEGCYLQAGGMTGHLGSYNKAYINYGSRRRRRFAITFPTKIEVEEAMRAGKHDTCVGEGGAWELVFRQTRGFKYSPANDWQQARRHNADTPEADNFSVLDSLEGYRNARDNKFTLKLSYPQDPTVFDEFHNGTATEGKVKYQESLRIFRQVNNPVGRTDAPFEFASAPEQRWKCMNDGSHGKGDKKNVERLVVGGCGTEDPRQHGSKTFENLFPTEWVPLVGKWHGLEYNGGGHGSFISGRTYRRYGAADYGIKGGSWAVGSNQKQGPHGGDDDAVKVVELHACRFANSEEEEDDDTPCPAGQRIDEETGKCTACAAGTYNAGGMPRERERCYDVPAPTPSVLLVQPASSAAVHSSGNRPTGPGDLLMMHWAGMTGNVSEPLQSQPYDMPWSRLVEYAAPSSRIGVSR